MDFSILLFLFMFFPASSKGWSLGDIFQWLNYLGKPKDVTKEDWTNCFNCFQFKPGNNDAFFVRRCGADDCLSVNINKNVTQTNKSVDFDYDECGIRKKPNSFKVKPKVRSESFCESGECPWLVRIEVKVTKGMRALCAGALIHPQWVLTAAHCLTGAYVNYGILFIQPESVKITYGEIKEVSDADSQAVIEKYIINPEFNLVIEGSPYNDIALIKLTSPVVFDEYTQPICLPSSEMMPPINSNCMVAGWGKVNDETLTPSTYPRKTFLKVVRSHSCTLRPLFEPLPKSKICVHNEGGENICEGDSGTPLACEGPDANGTKKWFMFGIASYGGTVCDKTNKQNIFANVCLHIDWIKNTISKF